VVIRRGTLAELRGRSLTRVATVTPDPVPGLEGLEGVVDLTVDARPDGVHTRFRGGSGALGAAVGRVAASDPTTLTVEPPSLDELFRTNYRTDALGSLAGDAW
jgi:ABC-2 type transport system ATP-binding protein